MGYISILLLSFFISLGFSIFIIPRILLISFKKHLFDMPDERKVHKGIIPRLGGVSFFPAVIFTLSLMIGLNRIYGEELFPSIIGVSDTSVLSFGLSSLLLLYLTGITDDLIGVRYRQKFIVQLIAAFMFPLAGLYINDFYGLFGIHAVSPFIGIPLTLVLVIFITNAINLIDGIDGLASGLSMVALSVFGTLAVIDDRWMSALLAFTTVGVLLPFFFYNVFGNADRGRKIFMGDTGSLTLGYILSFLAVQYTMNTYEAGINYEGAILISFSVLLVPCLDVVRVVLGRVRRGKDPFMPDKTHIHHKFLAMGFTPRKAMISILCISFLFCASNVFLVSYLNNTVLFLCDVAVWTLMNLYISKLISRRNISQI